jgi:hypothetical protein
VPGATVPICPSGLSMAMVPFYLAGGPAAIFLVVPLFGAYMLEPPRHEDAPAFGVLVYWLFVVLLFPTARVIGIQASVPLMLGLLVWMTRVTTQPRILELAPQP